MKPLLILPVIIPMAAAALSLVLWRRRQWQRMLALAGTLALLAVAVLLVYRVDNYGIQAVQIGNWPAPFGVTMAADLFSAIMVFMTALMGLLITLYSFWSMDHRREAFGYYPLLMVLLMGVNGAFLTGDIFNLYVWFEVMLMASFVLLSLGGERPQIEGAFKYVTLNLISSAIFLSAVGILYGIAGTLNMADLSVKLSETPSPGLVTTVSMLFLVAFGIKAGAFPLFFWLPASYHTPPVAVSAIFAGLLTKVGVYALVRVFTLIFTHNADYVHTLILIMAGLTMVTGVLGAAAQNEFRRILSFHIVSQIGYMLMGLGLHTRLALAGVIFFIAHNIVAKSNLFLISGIAYHVRGSYELNDLGGLYKSRPWLSVLFMISAMSLAGIPPLSGFVGKLLLVVAGVKAESYSIVAVSLGVSILTLFSMTKIWGKAFWKPAPLMENGEPAPDLNRSETSVRRLMAPVMVLAVCIVTLGVGAEFFVDLSLRAADQLLDPSMYIQAVMGGGQ